MITSFFKTSKPIQYIIFLIVLICIFVYQRIMVVDFEVTLLNILKELGCFSLVLASFFTLIFIVTKNNLTNKNSFAALYFCLFIGLIPSCLGTNSILVSNFFVLLSLRRIVSLKTNQNIKKKLLDASMWICLATLFEPWAILFFLVLFFAMAFYSVAQIKNCTIPFCGILVVAIFLASSQLLSKNVFPNFSEYLPPFNFDTFSFNTTLLKPESLQFIGIVLFGVICFIVKIVLKNRLKTPNLFVLILVIFVAFFIAFTTLHHGQAAYLYAIAPSAIVLANFSETSKYPWISEFLVQLLIFVVLLQVGLNIPTLLN